MPRKHKPCAQFARALIVPRALVLLSACWPLEVYAGPAAVDLELVLAVDTSGSMSKAELLLQREGYVAALRQSDVGAAIEMRGAVAIAYVEWAGPDDQRIVVPWTVVSDATDVARLAYRIASAPLNPGFVSAPWRGGTSVSRALLFSADMFSSDGATHTIDISGNGPNNSGGLLAPVRERVIARGITINGLPIVRLGAAASEFPLALYYEDCVIGGPGAFAVPVDDPERLASAIRRKLLLEIAAMPERVMPATLVTTVSFVVAPKQRINCGRAGT